MNIEEYLEEQREKLQQDKNRILSSTFAKDIPKDFFLSGQDVDLNANSVEVEEPPISISGKLSLGNDSTQENEDILHDVSSMSKDSKNAANEIQLLQVVTHDDTSLQGKEKENQSSRSPSARKCKVSLRLI